MAHALSDLARLIDSTTQNLIQFKAISAVYDILQGGVPSIYGFDYLINENNYTNFGSRTSYSFGPDFNNESIFINVANALYQGNPSAQSAFNSIAVGFTLSEKLASVYNFLVSDSEETASGRAAFASQSSFYSHKAAELGIPGDTGAAVVAFGALLNVLIRDGYKGGADAVNDLTDAVFQGTALLPESGAVLTPLETADGINFDFDDNDFGGGNSPAFIGDPSNSVLYEYPYETIGDSLIFAEGVIPISDLDPGEAGFIETVIFGTAYFPNDPGNVGTLSLYENGTYFYEFDTELPAVRALWEGDLLIDTFTIESLDGTQKDVSFTIVGVDEISYYSMF